MPDELESGPPVSAKPLRAFYGVEGRYRMRRVRVLVCGGRDYADEETLHAILSDLHPSVVIHGGCASGADKLASRWVKASGTAEIVCLADWVTHRRAAGPIRNQKMLDEHTPELVVAFPGGRGTADMVRRARKAGIPVLEIARDGTVGITDAMAMGLLRIRDRGPEAWCEGIRGRTGGAISRMFDRMGAMGLCTPAPHTITDLGRRAVQPYERRMRVRERRLMGEAAGR